MLQETRAYVAELLREDLSVTHLVDSDFTFLNERLVRHYADDNEKDRKSADGVASPLSAGNGLQKVSLTPSAKRGGLVTQGAVLKVTADGTSTSPVVRGVFINERILGNHIPPPPPGIPAIEPDIRGATSIRDQLDKHRNNESCASCHRTIDPPGFALENYDPVGIWRTSYGQGNQGVQVNSTGTTPDGTAFTDLAAWKQIYIKRADQLARAFATQFLTYSTGAPPRFSEQKTLHTIVSKANGMRSIVREAVLSDIFLTK